MFKLFFFTSSQSKLSNIRHLCKDRQVDILSFQEITYRANYNEPQIDDHEKLLRESFEDALQRWQKGFEYESNSQTFFIEDTSVVIHALSDKKDVPGPNIKYWMRDANFNEVDKLLKEKNNDRRVTVRSDILLFLPKAYRRENPERNFAHFTSSVDGFIVDKEEVFSTNLLYPWLDNKTFNKWFTPYENGKPISMLPINEACKYDFRQLNVLNMLNKLEITSLLKENQLQKQLTFESFESVPTFILCGPTCTGKTTLAEHLSQSYGFVHIEASDFMHLEFYQRHGTQSSLKLVDFAQKALEDMPEIVAAQVIAYAQKSSSGPLVISGFRNIKEINWFNEHYLKSPVIPVYIKTNFKTRLDRCKKRARDDHKGEVQDFKETDEKQYGMGLRELEKKLDKVITNDLDKNELYNQFTTLFSKDIKNLPPYLVKQRIKALTLQELILLSLLDEYDSKKYFTTTEISKLINQKLTTGQKAKDNVSRYFNQTFHPYYEIEKTGKYKKYRLSNTGYSFALQIKTPL